MNKEIHDELYEICDSVHATCNDDCPVFRLNGGPVNPDRGCDCFKNGKVMLDFINANTSGDAFLKDFVKPEKVDSGYICPKCKTVDSSGKFNMSDNGELVECKSCKFSSLATLWDYQESVDPDGKFIDMTPQGYRTIAGALRCTAAMKKQQDILSANHRNLQDFVETVSFLVLENAISSYGYDENVSKLHHLYSGIGEFKDAADELHRAVCGQPPKLEV